MATIAEGSAERGPESDDELPQLSEYAQTALREFYEEQETRDRELQSRLTEGGAGEQILVQENWVCVHC